MELQNGRPETTSGRLDKEIRVYDLLDKLGIAYQRVDHEATMTMEACEEVDRILGDDTTICKNLFLCNRQETNFCQVTSHLRPRICQHRSTLPACPSLNRNIWKNIWTSLRDLSV